ncbi:MAG TPA: hypothetical protein K8U92_06990 [Aliarcobacter thereius]|nr:hypothetical protein [Aliarcobacter thereius]HJE03609.1 hypothetical protein [Aliarcobacter thereius]
MIRIEDLKINDKVLIDEIWFTILENWNYKGELCIKDPKGASYSYVKLKDYLEFIEDVEKFIPTIRYQGATVDIESYIKDGGNLLYLECVGQEDMVKSITSVLMQGRTRMNEHSVDSAFIGWFSVNKAGNKRKMVSLTDGIAHSILYHSPTISDVGFSLLIGRDDNELLKSFSNWLEKSQPLPYPKNLTKEIFEKLKDNEKLEYPITYNIKAVKINLSILENEYTYLQNIILDVCRENNLIDLDFIDKNIVPININSTYLSDIQVKKIFDTLNSMPKTYELENVDIKPVGLKLFGPNFNIYVVEADKNPSMEQCFGYVENLSAPDCSEWGYINIPHYLETTVAVPFINTNKKIGIGFEQDLYFKDRFITEDGEIITKEQKENLDDKFVCPNCKSINIEFQEVVDGREYYSCIDCEYEDSRIAK